MFLTYEEIVQLTGRKRYELQRMALRSMGIEYRDRPDGSIAVLKSHVEDVLCGGAPRQRAKVDEPNWGALQHA